jgi:hypothetical protein
MTKRSEMRIGGLFLKIFASGVAVALLLIYLDERKLGQIKAGLSDSAVRQLLGPPQWVEAQSECTVYFYDDCKKDELTKCSIYERTLRRDLIVGFDHDGLVICTDRISTFHVTS